jgi:hypothetical protein
MKRTYKKNNKKVKNITSKNRRKVFKFDAAKIHPASIKI